MNKDIKLRLFERRFIDETTNCWLWKGTINTNGYGSIKYKGKAILVHRLSLIVFKDVVFGINEQANHIKECKNKHCFNPDHLYKGTQVDNMTDFGTTCKLCGESKVKGKRCRKCKMKYNREYYSSKNQHRQYCGRKY